MSVTFFDEAGNPIEYKMLHERYQEFLKTFPTSEGYQYTTEICGILDHQQELSGVLKNLASAKPDLALSYIKENNLDKTFMVTATLMNKDGVTLCRRHARGVCANPKDLESLETAAFQRLVAATGFDGRSLKDDEELGMKAQGLTTVKPPGSTVSTQDTADQAPVKSTPLPASPTPLKTEAKPPVSKKVPEKNVGMDALLRSIRHQARMRNVAEQDIPQFASYSDARNYYRDLMKSPVGGSSS